MEDSLQSNKINVFYWSIVVVVVRNGNQVIENGA